MAELRRSEAFCSRKCIRFYHTMRVFQLNTQPFDISSSRCRPIYQVGVFLEKKKT